VRTVKNAIVIAVAFAAVAAHADQGKFSAADVPGAKLRASGRVVISNDTRAITAYHFFGNIREAMFSIRSAPMATHAYNAVVFDSSARVQPSAFSDMISDAAKTHGVDPRLVAAVARRESAWNANAVSRTGACGLMQLMPATARFLGITNIFDPRENILGGTRYLRTLLDTFHGDLDLTLAAYNAGPGAVQKYNGVPPFRETRAYVSSIRAAYQRSLHD